jgi:hypothetical protein
MNYNHSRNAMVCLNLLLPSVGFPVLCGIEVVAEGW